MLSRWLRWLVVAPVLLFVFGAILLSCSGGSSGGPTATAGPGFSLQSITISTGAPVSPTFTPPPPSKTPKATPTATLTPRPPATTTCVPTTAPSAVASPVAFNAIGTYKKGKRFQFRDITAAPATLWTSVNSNVLNPSPPGDTGGLYTPGIPGCTCIVASSSGLSSQFVGVGVGVANAQCMGNATPFLCCTGAGTGTCDAPDSCIEDCPACTGGAPVAPAARSAGVLMWTFDAGAGLRGRIATGPSGSIFFITRDGVLHGLNSSGKETLHRAADGASPAAMPDGTVIAMTSRTELGAIAPDGATIWHLDIGASVGPLAATDRAIYAASGGDLVSVSTSGTLNWRVGVGDVRAVAVTPDGVVAGSSHGAVTSLASDGAVEWSFQPDGGFSGSVAYADEVVYAGSSGGGVYALDSRSGDPIWHVNAAHAVTAGPAVAPSGTIFAGADTIYGVSAAGQLRWQDSTLPPGGAGLVVLGYDGVFDAAAPDMGAVLMGDGSYVWASRSFGRIATAASSVSGMLYVGTSTGRIFAVR